MLAYSNANVDSLIVCSPANDDSGFVAVTRIVLEISGFALDTAYMASFFDHVLSVTPE